MHLKKGVMKQRRVTGKQRMEGRSRDDGVWVNREITENTRRSQNEADEDGLVA